MERTWLKHYPPGTPAEIETPRYSSLVALLEESFDKYRDLTAFVCMDKALTYHDLDDTSRAFGAWLQSKGLQKGARVAIMMPNVLQYPIVIVGILRAGYIVVNTNPRYTARELELQLKGSGAEAIIVLENFAHTLEQAIARTNVKHVVIASLGDLLGTVKGTIVNLIVRWAKKMVPAYALPEATPFNEAIAAGKGMTLNRPQLGPDDLALLQYTGGTTGIPKGVMLLHRNLVANMLQIEGWIHPVLEKEPKVDRLTIVAALPLYHIFAFIACFLVGFHTGGQCILIPDPRNIPNLIKELAKRTVNYIPAVNTFYNALLNHPDFGKIDWSMLKCAVGGGMTVQQAVAERWFRATGCPIVEGYGLSEAPVLTCNLVTATEWTGTIGLPIPSTDISIRGDDNNEVLLGEAGEICARGPQVMRGYWQLPDETARVMTPDGYFRTGDIGVINEMGQVRIVDRKKDMISVSGFKVYPNEIEAVVSGHPGVRECAAIPHARSGEVVKLFVVKNDPNLTEEELLAYCQTHLTDYKVPKSVEFMPELPHTNVGKVLRRQLRDEPKKLETRAA